MKILDAFDSKKRGEKRHTVISVSNVNAFSFFFILS